MVTACVAFRSPPGGAGRKAHQGIRLRPVTPRVDSRTRPEGRCSPAQGMRQAACPMPHFAVRSFPALWTGECRSDLDHGENCGPTADVTQLIEHLICSQGLARSIPAREANLFSNIRNVQTNAQIRVSPSTYHAAAGLASLEYPLKGYTTVLRPDHLSRPLSGLVLQPTLAHCHHRSCT